MKKELFEELLESVRQGGAIMKGTMKPLRTFEFPESEVRKIRQQYGLSQDKFAVLLRVAAAHPDALLDIISNKRARKQA